MAIYRVELTARALIQIEIKADDEEQAIDLAYEKAGLRDVVDVSFDSIICGNNDRAVLLDQEFEKK